MNRLIAQLRPIGTLRTFRAKESLFFQNEVPQFACVIVSGMVRAYSITPDGEERIAALYGRGDILPLAWALGGADSAVFYYDIVSDARIITVPRQALFEVITASPNLTEVLLTYAGKNYASLLFRITGLTQSRAIDKICYTFYYLLFRFGEKDNGDWYRIDVRLSQTNLADLIGQTRESTAKNIKVLRDAGVIRYKGLRYAVNKSRLEHFLGEDSFSELDLTHEE